MKKPDIVSAAPYFMKAAMTILISCLCFHGCIDHDSGTESNYGGESISASLVFGVRNAVTKALDPDEEKISDINLFIFNSMGVLEHRLYLSGSGAGSCNVRLLKNGIYSIYVCANFGYRINAASIEDLKNLKYYLAYPDDYSIGLPMSGYIENTKVTEDRIEIPLERLMARVTVRVDRSRLADDVEFNVRSIQVEGCPRSVYPFNRNHIRDPFDFFPSGFIRKDYETDILNTAGYDGKSGKVCLYLLENMQGDLLPGNTDEKAKVLPDNAPEKEFCSYIEIKSEYLSDAHYTQSGKYLIYRLYPGENPGNFDICRNYEYNICIIPEGTGLDGDEWRIDKSGIENSAKTLELSYSTLNFSYIGESTRIVPYLTPENTEGTRLYWDSDDKSVATVSSDGTVTAKGEGKCSVICYAADGSGCSAECMVTVNPLPYYMKIFPGNFIRCEKGEIIEVKCEYFPNDTPFDIGIEELEYDKNRGIYDYGISEDGKAVTIYTKERGTGLLYMETGYPVNQSEMIVLVID